MTDPTIILPKPTVDPDEFEVRAAELLDASMRSGRRRDDTAAAMLTYQMQCFALFLRQNARKAEAHLPWGSHRLNDEQFEILDAAIHGLPRVRDVLSEP